MDKRMTIAAMAEQVLQRFGPQEERHHDGSFCLPNIA